MPGRRSLAGVGRVSLIYTIGEDDRPRPASAERAPPVLSVSVGEDFAECSWPVVLKSKADVTKPQLLRYIDALAGAVRKGFWMSAGTAPTVFWEWTGSALPGMEESGRQPSTPVAARTRGTGRRAAAGAGQECALYLMDAASHWQRPGFHGRIRGNTAVSASLGEDFAVSHWPVVVKAAAATRADTLAQYLADLAACVRDGLFVDVANTAA